MARAPRTARAAPDLRLETRLVSDPSSASGARKARLLPVSLALHAAFLVAVLLAPLIGQEVLPPAATGGRAFFVSPVSAAPPPPPPPPPSGAAAPLPSPPKPRPASTPAFTAPIQTPEQVKPEEGVGLGSPGGEPGGVAEGGVPGGVAGGVVGGVVGGVKDAPPPQGPVRAGSVVKEPRKLKHVEATYPRPALLARVEGLVVLECTIDVTGHVSDVRILRGVPGLDEAALGAVKQWAYAPTLLDGVPVPVIMTVTVSFNLKQARAR